MQQKNLKNKRSQKNLSLPLMTALALSLLFRLLAGALTLDGHQWQSHDAAMHFNSCLLIAFIVWMLPYKNMAAKCASSAWLGFEFASFFESLIQLFDIVIDHRIMLWQCSASIVFAMLYCIRSCFHVGDDINDRDLFIMRLRPRSAQDFIMSMFNCSGLGGIGIYYNRQFWHYKNGRIVKECALLGRCRYVPIRQGVPAQLTIAALDSMVGSKWSITHNCITMLYWTVKRGKPLIGTNKG